MKEDGLPGQADMMPRLVGLIASLQEASFSRKWARVLRCIALALAALQAWAFRYAMNPDGVNYLDIADAYFRRDWAAAVNSHWSPLYSWILGVVLTGVGAPAEWEYPLVHAINFVIFGFALLCFEFFLLGVLESRSAAGQGLPSSRVRAVSDGALAFIGYLLFTWASLNVVTVSLATPDLLMSALVFLAAGLMLRIRARPIRWDHACALGFVLGVGYLAKSPMLPLGCVIIVGSFLGLRDVGKRIVGLCLGLLFFGITIFPFVVFLSSSLGRFTLGDTAKDVYVSSVNLVSSRPVRAGTDAAGGLHHPLRVVIEQPLVWEYAAPIGGTYPPELGFSYWFAGATPHFRYSDQWRVLRENAKIYFEIFFEWQGAIVCGFVALCFYALLSGGRVGFLERWDVILLSSCAFAGYGFSLLEPRYLGPFIVVFWVALFSGIRASVAQSRPAFVASIVLAMALNLGVAVAMRSAESAGRELVHLKRKPASVEVLEELRALGIKSGDQVALVGYKYYFKEWGRLARIRFVAEVAEDSKLDFWTAPHEVRQKVYAAFSGAGARFVISEYPPRLARSEGWLPLGKTPYFIYVLRK